MSAHFLHFTGVGDAKSTLLALILVGMVAPVQAPMQRAWGQSAINLDPEKTITQFHIDHWGQDEGLPQQTVNTVIQTRDGYLWVGTQEGLVRFDGHSFTVFNARNSGLQNDHIKALHERKDGSIWVGTMGGGVSRFQDGQFATYTVQDSLPSNLVSAIAETKEGRLWIGTFNGGLARYDGCHFTAYTGSDGLPGANVTTLLPGEGDTLWVGTRENGLGRWVDGTFRPVDGGGAIPPRITSLAAARDGGFWIGTGNRGVLRYRDGVTEAYTTDEGLSANTVLALHEDRDGTLWIGTEYEGLNRLVDGALTHITTDHGLSHNVVEALLQGREGSLWIGTAGGGLNRLRDGKFATYTVREGVGSNQVYTVTEDTSGHLWVGTEGGGVSRLQDGRVAATYTTEQGLASNVITALYGSRDGSVWIGTLRDGLNRLVDGRVQQFTPEDGLPSPGIYGLFEASDGTLWVATGKGLARYREGTFTGWTTEDGLPSNLVTTMAEDADGHLWVGTFDEGLHELQEGEVTAHYTVDDGLESNTVLDIHVDRAGGLWVATQEGGLHRVRGDSITSFTAADGLFDDTIMAVLEDRRGKLWMSTNRGLFTVPKAQLEALAAGRRGRLDPVVYGKSDGLRSVEFNGGVQPAAWRDRTGHLWFPSTQGVVQVDPNDLRRNTIPPPIVIEELRAEGTSLPLTGAIELAPGQDKVEFSYAGLSFHAPEEVQYRYRLSGVDEDWVDAGSRRTAFYTNLEPGTYTFEVMARNSDGVWSAAPAAIQFTHRPFFYQTTWFFVLCGLFVLGLGAAGYRLRVRHLKRRQEVLEQEVAERTQELRQEKERTEDALQEAHRQRKQVQEAKEVIEEQADQLREMDRIKTRFFNNISHEFRTPLTLNIGPLENALTGMYGPVQGKLRRHLEMVLRNSRRLLRLINQLLDLSKIDSDGMELSRQRGNLAQLLEGVVLSFSYFSAEKDIDMRCEADRSTMMHVYDADALEKVFFNLISNAVKFTPEGGAVTASITRREAAGPDGTAAYEVTIRDTGPGIPEDELPYIFDRFRQVDGTVSQMQEGTGIGLSLVKELVELHDGSIRIESEEGVGTTFIITLPVVDEGFDAAQGDGDGASEGEAARDPVSHGPMVEMAVFDDNEAFNDDAFDDEPFDGARSDGAHMDAHDIDVRPGEEAPTLLVVDDNADIRTYVQDCLDDQYHVLLARDGHEALETMQAEHPDLVVSDVMMPGLDGYALCQRVRADAALQHTPIILLTAKASLDNKLEGLSAGADDYLHKPFDARELRVRVRNLLDLRAQQRELQAVNQELQATNQELKEADELKTEFLRLAAHDMKNPLNGIREFAKILSEELEDEGMGTEISEMIYTSADEMLQMVTRLLESAALEDQDFTLDREAVDVQRLAQAVVEQNRRQAERKDQRIALDLPVGEACTVEADPTWIQEAMDNLVSNAVKYSPHGKPIRVAVTTSEVDIRFAVEDEGPGLTEEDKEKLFGKFERLSAAPTGDESSTGLGLSIVKQIIEKHDGRVWAESTHGEGSTFFIALPRSPADVQRG